MTQQHIEKMVSIMSSKNVGYNKQFGIILQRGFYNEAAESFAAEILASLDTILEVGNSSEFNPGMKKAVKMLTDLAVKSCEDLSSMEFVRLKQKYKACVSKLKLPANKPEPAAGAPANDAPVAKKVDTEYNCRRCGGVLTHEDGATEFKCKYCGSVYSEETVVQDTKQMEDMFDAAKRETVRNCLRNLHDAVNATYVSSEDVKNAALELKKYIPDDFRANFYLAVASRNIKDITSAIRNVDVDRYYDDVESMVKLLIESLELDFLLELTNLVERAYKKRDMKLYGKYATEISKQAEKVDEGVFVTTLPREVFVAYSGKDMDYVQELVDVLEGQGLQCFVAQRNLRHGTGSVEDYEKAIKEAIDSCKSFVFVSTTNSRSFSCDAIKIELPYVKKHDIDNSPPEYRNNYETIPHKYKKPRVEYRIESSTRVNAADKITNEFFHGYEWVLSPEDVADRIMKQLIELPA